MKRILALILTIVLCLGSLAGCGSDKIDTDKGAIIRTYLTYMPYDLDPAKAYYDTNVMQVFSLIYEGLTRYDKSGKLEKVIAKSWNYEVDKRDGYLKLLIKLGNNNYWSDGIPVDSQDFVYAWKRILTPEMNSPAAAMLYPIKNAKKIKSGELTVDDLGVNAVSDFELEVVFEKDYTDVDHFLSLTASPALVPLREDVTAKSDEWAQSATTMVTNGPFAVKAWSTKLLSLDRSIYYKGLNKNPDAKYDKFVKPNKILVAYDVTLENQGKLYDNNELFYMGAFTPEQYKANEKKLKTSNTLSTYTYYFNTKNKLFKDEKVRQALSIALDRKKVASITGMGAVPATGFVPSGIQDTKKGSDFRKEGGNLISTSADLNKAKALLKEAGVTKGSFSIKYLKREGIENPEKAVAEYAAEVWKGLGFTVKTQPMKAKLFQPALNDGDFDVIGLDYQSLTADAFSFMVPFGTETSGSVISLESDKVEYTPHVTGFSDKKYDAIIADVLAAKDQKTRAKTLHDAEKYLVDKAPMAPLYYNVSSYMSQKLSGIETTFFGQKLFDRVKQSSYKKYLPKEDTSTATTKTAADKKTDSTKK